MTTAYILAVLLFYSAETGRPSYTLLSDNWLSQHDMGHHWRQHQVQYGDLNLDGKTDMQDFEILSACYVPSGIVPVSEPNKLTDTEQFILDKMVKDADEFFLKPSEPNDNAFGQICYTVGGKCHLYSDCRYLKGKEWKPCLCEDGNMCLVCLARNASE